MPKGTNQKLKLYRLAQIMLENTDDEHYITMPEIMEELDTEVAVGEWIETVEYDYPGFHLSMDCFWCEIVKGDLVLKEHEAARWLTREELTDVEWLPADVAVAEKIEGEMD